MTVGEQIRKARKAAKITQKELGKELGVSPQMIAQNENGDRNPKKETLEKIADALHVFVGDLYGDGIYLTGNEFESFYQTIKDLPFEQKKRIRFRYLPKLKEH